MSYDIRLEKTFIKRMDHLTTLFNLSVQDTKDAREAILDAVELLATEGQLPAMYDDHVLEHEPWRGYREFHVLADLWVVYSKIDVEQRIRMVTITNHQELASGKRF